MQAYIQEDLKKGFIHLHLSSIPGFFFVKKKDSGLRPCIDFHNFNEITVKYRYPLPLVPSALKNQCNAQYFNKLDLRSDKITTGHYEYLVMPFGLCFAPSVFQAFVNYVFRDMPLKTQ